MAFEIVTLLLILAAVWTAIRLKSKPGSHVADLSALPHEFVVFDLETTGLSADRHEIIEIGAIRVTRDAEEHVTFSSLVKPKRRVSAKIVELTGINAAMLAADGRELAEILPLFREFVGELRLVSFNAEFDMAFINAATDQLGHAPFDNQVSCALKMARLAWPNRRSYRLSELAKDGGLSMEGTHRALGDSHRALIVFAAAARELGRAWE